MKRVNAAQGRWHIYYTTLRRLAARVDKCLANCTLHLAAVDLTLVHTGWPNFQLGCLVVYGGGTYPSSTGLWPVSRCVQMQGR